MGFSAGGVGDAFVDVKFELSEGLFVSLDGHAEGVHEAFGGIEVHNDSFRHLDGGGIGAVGLGIESEVEDQFFGRTGDSREIAVVSVEVTSFHDLGGVGILACVFSTVSRHGVRYS